MLETIMPDLKPITFAIAVNSREVFENNFMASPIFSGRHPHQILVQEGFGSATKAYNDAIDRSVNELIVFAHQDMIFPSSWLLDLEVTLALLRRTDPAWGVLGCYGETRNHGGRGYVYSGGLDVLGRPFDHPAPVQTLDEIVLVLRKSSGLRYDENLPHFHFYGADICLEAAARGMNSYAISAFCIHNTQQYYVLPKEFYESYRYLKRKWRKNLPIQTTCVRITKFDIPVYGRRIREAYLRFIRRRIISSYRASDGRKLLTQLAGFSGRAAEMTAQDLERAPR
jgi:hypothetical protein